MKVGRRGRGLAFCLTRDNLRPFPVYPLPFPNFIFLYGLITSFLFPPFKSTRIHLWHLTFILLFQNCQNWGKGGGKQEKVLSLVKQPPPPPKPSSCSHFSSESFQKYRIDQSSLLCTRLLPIKKYFSSAYDEVIYPLPSPIIL